MDKEKREVRSRNALDEARARRPALARGLAQVLGTSAQSPRAHTPRRLVDAVAREARAGLGVAETLEVTHIDVTHWHGRYCAKFHDGSEYWADNMAKAIGGLVLEYGEIHGIAVKRPKR